MLARLLPQKPQNYLASFVWFCPVQIAVWQQQQQLGCAFFPSLNIDVDWPASGLKSGSNAGKIWNNRKIDSRVVTFYYVKPNKIAH